MIYIEGPSAPTLLRRVDRRTRQCATAVLQEVVSIKLGVWAKGRTRCKM